MLIYMNLVHDFEEIVSNQLSDRGHKNPGALEAGKTFSLLFDNGERKVPEKLYSVKLSTELAAKAHSFQSSAVLKEVITRLETGESVQPYLSKDTRRIHRLDGLLLHWGINHLHLTSITTVKRGFVGRSDFLLFFRKQDDVVYLIDVLPHPKKEDLTGWTQSKLVRIADRNWPHLHQLVQGASMAQSISDEDYAALRAKNICTVVEADRGVVFAKIGVSAAGHSIDSLRVFDRTNDRLENLQVLIQHRYEAMFPTAQGYVTSLSLLAVEEDGFVVRDACTSKVMLVPNQYVLG